MNHLREKLGNFFFLSTSICQTKSHYRTDSYCGVFLGHALVQQTVSGIAIVPHISVDETNGEQATRNDVRFLAIEISIDLR